ncbi:MAG: acyl carrier protein [Clostridia bacterium]|nr:acyl carrier protein [Clostridia bacterium]
MIFDRLLKVFKQVMPYADTARITPDSALILDLHIDSVTLLMLVLGIEDEFGVRFDNLDNTAFNTVGDVIAYIEEKLN